MQKIKPLLYGLLAIGLAGGVVEKASAESNESKPPSNADIGFAAETAGLMQSTVVAALVQEINETTPENAAHGSRSISLIFDDRNPSLRLVGTLDPVSDNDYPRDAFEVDALDSAMAGEPGYAAIDRTNGKWYYRLSMPLSNFATQCAYCHSNFESMASTARVGALMLQVPIGD